MNSILTNLKKNLFYFLLLFFSLSRCGSIESEKSYCEKQAEKYFFLCLINVAGSPNYFGNADLASAEVQSYSQAFCIAEYNRKLKCPDKKTYRPHQTD